MLNCLLECPNGFKKGDNDCPLCECNPEPDTCPGVGMQTLFRVACLNIFLGDISCNKRALYIVFRMDVLYYLLVGPHVCCIQVGHVGPRVLRDSQGCEICDNGPVYLYLGWTCWTSCTNGYVRDSQGCEICDCAMDKVKPACTLEPCIKSPPCQHGFVVDQNGQYFLCVFVFNQFFNVLF